MATLDARRQTLMTQLATLDTRLHRIEAELDEPHTKDWDDAAIEHETDEVLEQLGHAGEEEIRGIRAALQRIRDGEYGICTRCGAEISSERLDLLPATPFCKTCAAEVA
jgi:RNA polymerase-binding transcription factor DksA